MRFSQYNEEQKIKQHFFALFQRLVHYLAPSEDTWLLSLWKDIIEPEKTPPQDPMTDHEEYFR